MSNPYQAPDLPAVRAQFQNQQEVAREALRGPAIGLISVAAIGLFIGLACIGIDVLLLASGAVDRFDNPDLKRFQILFRTAWGLVMVANCGFSIWAGIQMQKLRQHQLCWLAGVLACIPVIGPCFCLGMPFGIWAVTILNRTEIQDAFDR